MSISQLIDGGNENKRQPKAAAVPPRESELSRTLKGEGVQEQDLSPGYRGRSAHRPANLDDEDGQEYVCANAGCPNGIESTFVDAPSAWFEGKGLSSPKSCHDCRRWIKTSVGLGDQAITCTCCKRSGSVSHEARFRFHRAIGNWEHYWEVFSAEPLCEKCSTHGNFRSQQIIKGLMLRVKLRDELRGKGGKVTGGAVVAYQAVRSSVKGAGLTLGGHSFNVPTDPAYYSSVGHGVHGDVHQHIAQHLNDPSMEGVENSSTLIKLLAALAYSTDADTLTLRDKKYGTIVKIDIQSGLQVCIKEDKRSPTGYRLTSGFVSDNIQNRIAVKIKNKEWAPYC